MKAEVVFLDVGGIILEIDWKKTLTALKYFDPESQEQVLKKVRNWNDIYHYERGRVTRDDFFKGLSALLGLENTLELQNAFNQLVVGPLPGAETIFDEFSGRIPLVALSNTNDCHHEYQSAQFPILKRFDRFLSSFELGHRKPDPEIFIAALEKFKLRPEQAIFVDDSLANVEAAQRVGLRAFQTVNSPEQTVALLKKELSGFAPEI